MNLEQAWDRSRLAKHYQKLLVQKERTEREEYDLAVLRRVLLSTYGRIPGVKYNEHL